MPMQVFITIIFVIFTLAGGGFYGGGNYGGSYNSGGNTASNGNTKSPDWWAQS